MKNLQSLVTTALLAAAPFSASAQGMGDASLAPMPQYVSVKIGSGATAKTVSQLSIPLVLVVPVSSRFNIDVATGYASSDVSVNGKSLSSINGLTDTQVRANLTLGNDAVVFTLGANIPTGQYQIPEERSEAAGQIGSDFLIFPTSSYGSGLSTTGGVAVARSLGNWNVGVAGSFRKSSEFDAYQTGSGASKATLTFTPADEVRARLGVDRNVGDGHLALGVTYSSFGSDVMANTSYATGARIIGQASLYMPLGTTDLYLSGWGLRRAEGQRFGGVAPPETVANVAMTLGFHSGGVVIEPSLEGRSWQVDGVKAGTLANGGLRVRWSAGAFSIIPSASYQVGKLYSTSDGSSLDVTGYRVGLTIRLH